MACALIDKGRVLISKRREGTHLAGKWEFPGGKVNPGETAVEALKREMKEELSIIPDYPIPLMQIKHSYPEKQILLDVWQAEKYSGTIVANEGQEFCWSKINDLNGADFPSADVPVITALKLPTIMIITPEPALYFNKYDFHGASFQKLFLEDLERTLSALKDIEGMGGKERTALQLRSKILSGEQLKKLATSVKAICREKNVKFFMNGNLEIAIEAGVDGIHFPHANLSDINKLSCRDHFLIGTSCHTFKELELAEKFGVDYLFVSPVNVTKTHPEAMPIGWEGFRNIVSESTVPVYALGGVNCNHIKTAIENGGQGVAAIRGFWKIKGNSSNLNLL